MTRNKIRAACLPYLTAFTSDKPPELNMSKNGF